MLPRMETRAAAAEGRAGVLVGSWPLGMPSDPATFYRRLVEEVDRSSYELLFTGDHLFAAGPSVDALSLLAFFAQRSARLTIGTGVLQLGLRDPVVSAKQLATIDMLHEGRLVLGVGVGGEFEDEWRAAAVPRHRRGARVDEYLELVRALWTGETMEHRGTFRTVEGVVGSPTPRSPGGPPIWIGGRSDQAVRRASRFQGWIAYAVSARRLRATVDRLGELVPENSRSDFRIATVLWTYVAPTPPRARAAIGSILGRRYGQDFDRFVDTFCAAGTLGLIRSRIEELRAAGAQDILICPQCPADEFIDQVLAVEPVAGTAVATAPDAPRRGLVIRAPGSAPS